MYSSLLSSVKEVVHVFLVKTLNFEGLNTIIKKIIVLLEKYGLKITAVVTDNNAINRKAMSLFSSPSHGLSIVYAHPFDCNRPLFFFIDTVHLFKNIRNNWLNQKDCDKLFSFHHLITLMNFNMHLFLF